MRNLVRYSWMFLFLSVFCLAQNNTSLTGTIIDSDSQVWANAGWTAQLQIPGGGGKAQFKTGGAVPLTNNGFFDVNGVILAGETLPNNLQIVPTGTSWKICVASVTSSPQQCFVFPVTGSTFNFGTKISTLITAPRIEAAKTNYAYNVSEIINPVNGTGYINTITGTCAVFTGMVYAGCGGGGAPVTSGSIQRNNGGTLGPSNGEIDVAGNATLKSYGGTIDANFLNETTPHVSNDAIRNSMQVAGNVVTVNQSYPSVEYRSYNGFRSQIFMSGADVGDPTPPFAYNTFFKDNRASNAGEFYYNPFSQPAHAPLYYRKFVKDDDELGSNGQATNYFPFVDGYLHHCCGVPQHGGFQSNMEMVSHFFIDNTMGISGYRDTEYTHNGMGDTHNQQHITRANGGSINGSDEFASQYRDEILEDANPFWGTVPASPKGTTIIPVTLGGGSNAPGEGKLMVVVSQQSTPFHITQSSSIPSYPNPAIWYTDRTFTPETFCQVDNPGSQSPPLTKGRTTPTAITLGNCNFAITTSDTVCIGSVTGAQQVKVTSAGPLVGAAQSITVNLEKPVNSQEYVFQGPNACKVVELQANQVAAGGGSQPYRDVVRVLGNNPFLPNNTLLYISVAAGAWTKSPNGNFSENSLGAGTVLTRDGSGNVTAPLVDFSQNFLGSRIHIVASDASYNGTFTVTTNTTSAIGWSNAGAAGSTTLPQTNWFVATNGFDDSSAVIGPGATVLQAENPVTRQTDGTVVIEEGNNITMAANNIVSVGPNENNPMGMHHESTFFTGFPSGSFAQGINTEAKIVNPCDGCSFQRVALQGNTANYLGGGGFRTGMNSFRDTTVGQALWNNYDMLSAPITGGVLRHVVGCGLRPCSSPGANYLADQYDGNAVSYKASWNAATGFFVQHVGPTGGDTTVNLTPHIWSVIINNGAGQSNSVTITEQQALFTRQTTVQEDHSPHVFIAQSSDITAACSEVKNTSIGGLNWALCTAGSSGYATTNGTIPTGSVGLVDVTNNKLLWSTSDTLTTDSIPRAIPTGSTMNGTEIPQTSTHTINKAVCYKSTTPIVLGACSTVVDASGGCTCI